ncbi:rCG38061 [Rattus norvegicus]|uniref:RCG38061 n=1 Tax=Rattus norvegicus TaxID=10116 RepID=A6IV15_RAT|nr:rCG38061 [Rattus norvegicus]
MVQRPSLSLKDIFLETPSSLGSSKREIIDRLRRKTSFLG